MTDLQAEKRALRQTCREIVAGLSAEYRRQASERIAGLVLSSAAYAKARTVFIYVATSGEPDTRALIRQALRDGKRVCVPRCREKPRMDAVMLKDPDDLVPGAYGISEPVGGEIVQPNEIDLAIVPCMATSRNGTRLGHGAGFYDAFLSGASMEKWCLCFDRLLFDDLPEASWDVSLDAVATESGVYFPNENQTKTVEVIP